MVAVTQPLGKLWQADLKSQARLDNLARLLQDAQLCGAGAEAGAEAGLVCWSLRSVPRTAE